MQGGNRYQQEAFSSLRLTLELCEELMDSIVTWSVPYKQLSTDRQRATWFVDGSPKVNGQHSDWKATNLIEGGKNRSAWCAELHAVFLTVMEELNSGKSPYVWVFNDS